MTDEASPDESKDEVHLDELRTARAAGDALAARNALAKLLAPYWEWARSIAYGKLTGVGDRTGDAQVIAQELLVRLVRALKRKTDFGVPFHVVARVNLGWLIASYWRDDQRDQSDPVDPAELPEVDAVEDALQSLDKQAAELAPWLDGLSARDRALLCERIFLDLPPDVVAERHGIEPNAVNVAFFRALKRARKNQAPEGVSDQGEGAA